MRPSPRLKKDLNRTLWNMPWGKIGQSTNSKLNRTNIWPKNGRRNCRKSRIFRKSKCKCWKDHPKVIRPLNVWKIDLIRCLAGSRTSKAVARRSWMGKRRLMVDLNLSTFWIRITSSLKTWTNNDKIGFILIFNHFRTIIWSNSL